MTTPPTEDQAAALMSAWAEHHQPSAQQRSRTWEALSARASAGELGPELDPEPSSALSSPTLAKPLLGLRLVLVGFAAAAVVAGVVWTASPDRSDRSVGSVGSDRSNDPQAVSGTGSTLGSDAPAVELGPPLSLESRVEAGDRALDDRGPDTAEAPDGSHAIEAESLERPEPRSSAEPKPTAPRAAGTDTKPPAPSVDTLAVEMQLLGAARTALKSGDTEAALAALAEHGTRFPRGALASERELSRITALCKAGRLDEAESTARRFAAAHPNSTQTKHLADTCIGDRL